MKKLLLFTMITSCAYAVEINFSQDSASLDYAQVTKVSASQSKDGSWCFSAAVRHNDEGWEHYANGWEVVDLQGNQLGNRPLAHPHDTEQPFTRSQCNIDIPEAISTVAVRAKCNQHGFGGKAVVIDLTASEGDGYTVKHSD